MNIIIVGAGEIGRHLAACLAGEAHRISLIEADRDLAEDLEAALDAKVIHGDGTSVSDLADADVGECELFLAMSASNTVNMMSCSIAKSMGVAKVVSRVHPSLQREEWLFDFRGHFSVDHIFSSERLAAIELAKFVRNPDSLVIEELARGRIELQQVKVGPHSGMVHCSLRDLKTPEGVRVAVISRGERTTVPTADSKIEEGDLITIFGEPRKLRDFAAKLQGKVERAEKMRVVIFGGNEYGFSLAQMLESIDCTVRVFERNPELCASLADRLSNATIINADATVVAELEEEQVGKADFFISTSTDDEDNVMSCLQAHTLGVKSCLTLIHRADYAEAISLKWTPFWYSRSGEPSRSDTAGDTKIYHDGFLQHTETF